MTRVNRLLFKFGASQFHLFLAVSFILKKIEILGGDLRYLGTEHHSAFFIWPDITVNVGDNNMLSLKPLVLSVCRLTYTQGKRGEEINDLLSVIERSTFLIESKQMNNKINLKIHFSPLIRIITNLKYSVDPAGYLIWSLDA